MFCSFLQNVEEEDCLDPHLLMMMMMKMMTMQMRMRITAMNLTAMKERMALCKNWCSHEQKYLSPCLLSLDFFFIFMFEGSFIKLVV